jgi:hypothetical protein
MTLRRDTTETGGLAKTKENIASAQKLNRFVIFCDELANFCAALKEDKT